MRTSSIVVDKAQELAAAGRHTEVIAYLGARDASEIEESPNLALLYGTAHARVGRHAEGLRWLDVARDQGALDRALTEADWAVTEGEASGDQTLWALALRGRAEIRLAQGEIGLARRALDEIRAIRSRVPDAADEAEDQRALALVLTAEGERRTSSSSLRCWRCSAASGTAGSAGSTWASSGLWSRCRGRECWGTGRWRFEG